VYKPQYLPVTGLDMHADHLWNGACKETT